MKGSSRWDGLHEDTNAIKSSARRRIISRNGGVRRPYYDERNDSAPSDKSNTTNGNWRRQTNPKDATILTAEDKKVKLAIQSLNAAVTAYANAFGSNSTIIHHEQAVGKSVDEISTIVFGEADLSCLRKRNNLVSQRQPVTPLLILWEGADSTFGHMKRLAPSKSRGLIRKLSYVAGGFLQLIKDNIQHSSVANDTAGGFRRPRSMTDLRLCSCASILLDFLVDNIHLQKDDDTSLIDYKSSLFACLANLLGLSALLGICDSDGKNKRSLLFPWGAEKTVDLVVTKSVLPFVNAIMENGYVSNSSKMDRCCPAVECLKLLLRDHSKSSSQANKQLSNHAAAIMAPLIIDVDENGRENQRPNPLRTSTLKVIVLFWNLTYQLTQAEQTDTTINNINVACQSVKAAVDSLDALKRGKMHHSGSESPPPEIDVAALCRQIQNSLQNELLYSNHHVFLELLASLCHSYPSVAAGQWHLFLEQPASHFGVSKSSKGAPLLLGYIEDATSILNKKTIRTRSTSILPDVLHTTLKLVSAMPLSHWIAGETKSKPRITGESYFESRVRNSMLRLIDFTYSLMTSIRDVIISDMPSLRAQAIGSVSFVKSIVIHTAKLAEIFCSSLPFHNPNDPLLQSAVKLVGCSGDIFVLCTKAMGDATADYLELLEMAAYTFSRIITDTVDTNSFNRNVTPSQYWLSDSASFEFLDMLLCPGKETTEKKEKKQIEMLSQIARICPLALAREPFNLASFCELCAVQSRDHDPERKLSGVKLIESFIIGRNAFQSEFASPDTCTAIVESICPVLLSASKDNEPKIRAVAVASLGQLSESEWSLLLQHSRCNGLSCLGCHYVQTILQSCSMKGEKNAKVRSSACKAIGDVSSCIISMHSCTDEFVCQFSQTICHEMENVLNDEYPPVKSMGLFAVGNIALSLKERFASREMPLSLLTQLNTSFSSACACLDDKDDKVIIGAIRAIGHLSYFIYFPDFFTMSESCPTTKLNLYKSTLTNLTLKVKRAIDDATEGSTVSLNWNQRNNIKKHAWGSCNTIGMLLVYSSELKYSNDVFIGSILSEQFRCVQFSNRIHDKIAAASVNSLVKLPNIFWQSLSDENDTIGRGIATCLCYLDSFKKFSNQKPQLSAYHEEVQSLMNNLLMGANANNFCDAFILRETIPFSVDFFYQWLVSCDLEIIPRVMKEVSIAVQIEGMQKFIDVSSVQMFLSRTAQQAKEKTSDQKCVVSTAKDIEEDDDEI